MLGLLSRRVLVAVAALGLLFATSGCLRLNLGLQVRPDDTVGGEFTAAWSDAFVAEADDAGLDQAQLDAFLDALLDGVPGTERTPYAEDGYTGATATFTDRPLTDFAEFGGDEWGYLRLDHTDRKYTLESHWDLRAAGFLDPAAFDDAEILLSVDFPARVTEHNGTLDGRTVTWTMTPGEEYDLTATAVENDGLAFLLAGIAFTLVVCGLLWLWQWGRLRRYSIGNPSA
ncbi:LppM family (lipo)protein [Glycomyces sp. NPDC048151]|uniref:LppM family (lipo)protein n=1 Tax=Glycomyces sp. NPDC048151 TaxID=3364002 RepID=UPI00371737D2